MCMCMGVLASVSQVALLLLSLSLQGPHLCWGMVLAPVHGLPA